MVDNNLGETSDLEIESALNGILMRTDLHRLFDAGTWVPMVVQDGRLLMYVVRTTEVSNQFAELWHNVEMQQLVGVDRRCLFARVAWVVLSLHFDFLRGRRLAEDNLLVRGKDGFLKEMTPEAFKQFSRSRSRNPSPTKRQRVQGLEENGGVIVGADLGCCGQIGNDECEETTTDVRKNKRQFYADEFQRGRKRFRTSLEADVRCIPTEPLRSRERTQHHAAVR
jgi:hypothetical protein